MVGPKRAGAASKAIRETMGDASHHEAVVPTGPVMAGTSEPYNRETPHDLLDLRLTPGSGLFVRNNGLWPAGLPSDPDSWILHIDGEVERPVSLTVRELRQHFPASSVVAVLECAGNSRGLLDPPVEGTQWGHGAVGCLQFSGVRLADILAEAGPRSEAVYTAHHSPDRTPTNEVAISRGLPLWKAMAPETLVAFEMNGEPLPPAHGGPLRIVAPGFPGSAWQKWVARIELRDREHDGPKMTGSDYRLPARPLGPGDPIKNETFEIIEDIPVKSLITWPDDRATLRSGRPLEVRGWAWSGRIPVAGVAVSFDGGTSWEPAALEATDDRWAWRRFRVLVAAPASGELVIVARATDVDGRTQPLQQAWNPRGYCNNGCHRVRLTVLA